MEHDVCQQIIGQITDQRVALRSHLISSLMPLISAPIDVLDMGMCVARDMAAKLHCRASADIRGLGQRGTGAATLRWCEATWRGGGSLDALNSTRGQYRTAWASVRCLIVRGSIPPLCGLRWSR